MTSAGNKFGSTRTPVPAGSAEGGIAHDLNNLFTVIVGNAEFLAEQLSAHPKLQRLACNIAAAGDRGTELAQHLSQTLAADGQAIAKLAVLDEQHRKALPTKRDGHCPED